MRPALPAPGAPRGMPISTVSTRPACSLPGATKSPILGPWNVAVAVARTASPSTSPVDALTPDGTSQATTRASCALMAAIAEASGSRGEPSKPVPSRASTTAPEPRHAQPVAAVVALADHDPHRPGPRRGRGHARQPEAGPLHEVERGHALGFDRPGVGGAHL